MIKKININTLVKFTLTEEGLKNLSPYDTNLLNIDQKKNKEIETELWIAMKVLGKYLYMGQQALIINNDLEINSKDLING
jgi:hypothetical protein